MESPGLKMFYSYSLILFSITLIFNRNNSCHFYNIFHLKKKKKEKTKLLLCSFLYMSYLTNEIQSKNIVLKNRFFPSLFCFSITSHTF